MEKSGEQRSKCSAVGVGSHGREVGSCGGEDVVGSCGGEEVVGSCGGEEVGSWVDSCGG